MVSISYEKFTLPNGLDVIVHEDHTLPIVAVNVWYHVGSKDEEQGRTGFAHLFEHVMFEGSKHHNRSYFEPLQKVGAVLNGSTTPDRTNYWENVPSNYLELALWLQSDRMGFLLDALDQKRFDIQRDVVKNERRQSYENRPYGMTHLVLQPVVFPTPHPYSWPTIGSQEHLDAADIEDVKAFFRRYYSPSNASIAVVGDVKTDDVRQLVERYFGDIPPGPAVNRIGRMDSDLRGRVSLTMPDKVQLPRLNLVWPTGPMFDPDEASLSVLGIVLGDGKSSRFYRSLVYEKQIARDVSVFNHPQEIAGEFHIQVTANPGRSLQEIEDLVYEELESIRREAPTEHEIKRAKNRIESFHVRQMERFGGFGGRADSLNEYNTYAGNPGLINTDIERYLAVAGEDVQRVASTALGNNYVNLSVLPEQPLKPLVIAIDRSVMPKAATSPVFNPPTPRRAELSNGLKIVFVEKPELPMVSIGLLVRAGGVTDSPDKPGLSHMVASMLLEGTSTRSSQQIADEMEYLGAHLSSDAAREYAFLSTETLTAHWPSVLEIIADVARDATFPHDELERVRKERLIDLKRVADNPSSIAMRASRALLYGPETVYGHPLSGTEQSVESITRDELATHFATSYTPENSTLIVVGDVTKDDIMSKAKSSFGDWTGPSSTSDMELAEVEAANSTTTTIYLADKPGAAQSVIRAGHLTIRRHDPDFYSLTLLNHIFGGQFTSRLNANLRQDKGYSYGYTSSIDWFTGPSSLIAGGGVQTAVTGEAVAETLKEFGDIRDSRPVTQEEFDNARDGILRGLPSQFETQSQAILQLARLVAFDLPDDYFASYASKIEAVTLDDVNRASREKIDRSHLKVLVVGDRQVVEPGLKDLGLPVVLVDYEGRTLS